jgi:hypothetical protein
MYFFFYKICEVKKEPSKYKGYTQPLTEVGTRNLLGVERSRRVKFTTAPPCVSRLYRKCGIPNISHPHRPPLPLTGIALPFNHMLTDCLDNVGSSTSHKPMSLHGLLQR